MTARRLTGRASLGVGARVAGWAKHHASPRRGGRVFLPHLPVRFRTVVVPGHRPLAAAMH